MAQTDRWSLVTSLMRLGTRQLAYVVILTRLISGIIGGYVLRNMLCTSSDRAYAVPQPGDPGRSWDANDEIVFITVGGRPVDRGDTYADVTRVLGPSLETEAGSKSTTHWLATYQINTTMVRIYFDKGRNGRVYRIHISYDY